MNALAELMKGKDDRKWSQWAPLTTPYWTNLPNEQEQIFRLWVGQNSIPFDPYERQPDYDMRGFWKALQSGDGQASSGIDPYDKKLHFSDRFKTPWHETYSNESQNALPGAPSWVEGRYLVDNLGSVLYDAANPRRRR